jgi:hypothetical protein
MLMSRDSEHLLEVVLCKVRRTETLKSPFTEIFGEHSLPPRTETQNATSARNEKLESNLTAIYRFFSKLLRRYCQRRNDPHGTEQKFLAPELWGR